MASLLDLYEGRKKFKAYKADYSQNYNWKLTNVIPFKGAKTLLIQCEADGLTQENTKHIINIQFQKLKYVDELPKNADYNTIEYNGEKYYVEFPTVHSQCTVRCSCYSFRFEYMYALKKHGILFGVMAKAYKKKTDRPPINPTNQIGACKHVMQISSYLKLPEVGIMK